MKGAGMEGAGMEGAGIEGAGMEGAGMEGAGREKSREGRRNKHTHKIHIQMHTCTFMRSTHMHHTLKYTVRTNMYIPCIHTMA